MIRTYRLKCEYAAGGVLSFEWDREAGTFTGPGSTRIIPALDWWQNGKIKGPPEPGVTYKTGDPRHDMAGLAVLLAGLGAQLTPEFGAAYPKARKPYRDDVVY